MRLSCQRPSRNGSSDLLTEMLVGLTVLGASALTVIAALGPATPGREPSDDGDEREERDDGR